MYCLHEKKLGFFFFKIPLFFLIFFFIATLFIYLCWVFGSCEGFPQLRQVGATLHRGAGTALHRGAWASHYRGPPRCGAQAPDAQAQQLWLTGPAAPWHVGSSQTRARTRVPCISRQTLNHCTTREAQFFFKFFFIFGCVESSFLCEGFSLVVASGGHSSSQCAGLSPSRPLLLWSTGSRRAGSVAVTHGPSRSAACGIFPDQGSNPCPLH